MHFTVSDISVTTTSPPPSHIFLLDVLSM